MHARMRGNGLKLHQGRFGLDIETFLLRRSNNTLTWAAQGGDQAPRTTQGSGWDGLTVDLNDLRGLFYPQWSHNSVCHAARPQKLQVCVSHQNLFAKLSCLLNQSCLALQRSPQPLQTGDRKDQSCKAQQMWEAFGFLHTPASPSELLHGACLQVLKAKQRFSLHRKQDNRTVEHSPWPTCYSLIQKCKQLSWYVWHYPNQALRWRAAIGAVLHTQHSFAH